MNRRPAQVLRVAALAFTVAMSGCVSLQSVSLTEIPAKRGRRVSAQADKFLIFMINFDNDYVTAVREKLRRQCRGGKVTGILTKDESINYFLGIFTRRQITARGYCVKT